MQSLSTGSPDVLFDNEWCLLRIPNSKAPQKAHMGDAQDPLADQQIGLAAQVSTYYSCNIKY